MSFDGSRLLARRHFLCACCGGGLLTALPYLARAEDEVIVPVTEEPRHHVRSENEWIRIIEAVIPPGDISKYHRHFLDSVVITARGGKVRAQKLGDQEMFVGPAKSGAVGYLNYLAKPLVHRVGNDGEQNLVFIDCEIMIKQPGGYAPDRRAVPAYASELDNDRVHIWRLKLAPGESASAITQSGPGVRVVVSGDRFTERVPGSADREITPQGYTYAWTPPGMSREIINTGTNMLEMVEFEVK